MPWPKFTDDYAGLDVSLKEISVCVVDADGAVIACGAADCDPGAVAGFFEQRDMRPERVVHESGQLSIWLQRGLVKAGLPAICIDARTAHFCRLLQRPTRAPCTT